MENVNRNAASHIIQTLTTAVGHMTHGRPGVLIPSSVKKEGVEWFPCTWVKSEASGEKLVYTLTDGKKSLLGTLQEDLTVLRDQVVKGSYLPPSKHNKLVPQVATYLYKKVVEVYEMDQTFVAQWASYAFHAENKDLKVILAAFLLVQPRKGEPIKESGEVVFFDDDYRSVGEAMLLHTGRHSLDPKLVARIGDVLSLPEIAQINRDLGFGRSLRKPFMGRYKNAVTKWLRFRENNPKMLQGLVQSGYSHLVKTLARRVQYKPQSEAFFKTLRWKQQQSREGHRTLSLNADVEAHVDLKTLPEAEVCAKIVSEKIGYKRLVGMVSELTPAMLAACAGSGGLSDKDILILTPTLEKMGVQDKEPFKSLLAKAVRKADDQRALHIAKNIKNKDLKEQLVKASDNATKKSMEQATRNLRVFVLIDISGSMDQSLVEAKKYVTQFLGGIPLDRVHVSVFNTMGRLVEIKAAKSLAVSHALDKYRAGGGTFYTSGLDPFKEVEIKPDEDSVFFIIGDGDGEDSQFFAHKVQASGLNPISFLYLHLKCQGAFWGRTFRDTVKNAAVELGIPCVMVDESIFNSSDPYAITGTLRDLIASTPTKGTTTQRKSLLDLISETPLLERPKWAQG